MDGTDVSEQTTPTAEVEIPVTAATPEAPAETAVATAEPETPAAEPAAAPAEPLANGDGGDFDAASLMEQFLNDPSHDYKTLKYGDVMDGIIMHIDRDELLVDIGSKSEGVVPSREFSSMTNEEKQALNVGDTVLVFVVQPENQEGHAVVSIDRARQEKSWRRLQDIYEANEVIEAEVTNYNKGGLLVNLDGVRGFVPASQVSEIRGGDEASKQADMARLIGSTLPLKVIEINRHRNRLILSERQAIQERRDVMKERLIEELKEGEVRKGRVSSICDFGAFVDIGGADGLVHLSELSWSRVRHPSEVLKVGQEVDVYVLGINAQEKKIALSIKRTQAEPWSRVATNYEVGQLVRGTVTQLANFGAFARIEDGIEGLIHVSELADERITHPKQVVQEGQELILRIIRIDPQRRRMGLSLRRALDTPDSELMAVFGEEILEERDRLVQRIRASLEAEGIEYGPVTPAATAEAEATAPAAEAAPEAPAASAEAAASEGAQPAEAPAPTAAAEAAPAAEPRARDRDRPRGGQARAADLPTEIDGEPLSAMALAFAMAGAEADLVAAVDESTAEPAAAEAEAEAPATTEPTAEAAPEAPAAVASADAPVSTPEATVSTEAAVPAAVEATGDAVVAEELPETETPVAAAEAATDETAGDETVAEETAPAEAEQTDEASGLAAAAGTVTGAIGGAAEAVAARVADVVEDVVEAVRPDGEASDAAADDETTEAGAEPTDEPETPAPDDASEVAATGDAADASGEPAR